MIDPAAPAALPFHHHHGNWVVCGISGGVLWPETAREVSFRGYKLVLIPVEAAEQDPQFGNMYPRVAFDRPPGMSFEDGQRIISSFLSAMAWMRRVPLVAEQWSGGSHPMKILGQRATTRTDSRFQVDDIPEIEDPHILLALAFYREGLSLNNVAYQCLSFFKVLNMEIGGGHQQVAWMNANWEAATANTFGLGDYLQRSGIDGVNPTVGQYLFGSNRCAVAHASGNPTPENPTIDPDDPVDRLRLHTDLPMVRALAEYLIETNLGVKSPRTIYREHLYELAGFKQLLGADLVARIVAEPEVELEAFPALPPLSVRQTFDRPYLGLEGMAATPVDCAGGVVALHLTSAEAPTSVLVALDFREERLYFDLANGISSEDDGSLLAAQAALARIHFVHRYIGNGALEIWSGEERLSRCDPYIPVNIDPNGTEQMYQAYIAATKAVIQQRQQP